MVGTMFDRMNVAKEYRQIALSMYGRRVAHTRAAMLANQRFVHYTSAEVAMSILENKSVWMHRIHDE